MKILFSILACVGLLIATAEAQIWRDITLADIHIADFHDRLSETPATTVSGKDLVANHRGINADLFQRIYFPNETRADVIQTAFERYENDLYQVELGMLIVARLLDAESLRLRIPSHVNESRALYIVKTVMANNYRRVFPNTELPLGNDELYAALRHRVGANSVRFNIDWKTCEKGMEYICASFARDPYALDKVAVSFLVMPSTFLDFLIETRAKLELSYRAKVRQAMFENQIRLRAGQILSMAQRNPAPFEMRNIYDRLPEPKKSFNELLPVLREQVQMKYMNAAVRSTVFSLLNGVAIYHDFNFFETNAEILVPLLMPETSFDPKNPSKVDDVTSLHRAAMVGSFDIDFVNHAVFESITLR